MRDADSAALLADLGLEQPVMAADPALSLPSPSVAPRDRFAVSLRPPLGSSRMLPASVSARNGVESGWIEAMARGFDGVAAAIGLTAHFVAFQSDRDRAQHLQVARRRLVGCTTAGNRRPRYISPVCQSVRGLAGLPPGSARSTAAEQPGISPFVHLDGGVLTMDVGQLRRLLVGLSRSRHGPGMVAGRCRRGGVGGRVPDADRTAVGVFGVTLAALLVSEGGTEVAVILGGFRALMLVRDALATAAGEISA